MQSYQIHLLRHGVTAANLYGQYIGRTDVPLAPEGIEALKKLAATGAYPKAEVYYTSPRLRCIQSMQDVYKRQAGWLCRGAYGGICWP